MTMNDEIPDLQSKSPDEIPDQQPAADPPLPDRSAIDMADALMAFASYSETIRQTRAANTAYFIESGIRSELGELYHLAKGEDFHGKPHDEARWREEMGDLLYYLCSGVVPDEGQQGAKPEGLAELFTLPDLSKAPDPQDRRQWLGLLSEQLHLYMSGGFKAEALQRSLLAFAILARGQANVSLADLMRENEEKVRARFPEGYSHEAYVAR